MKWIKHDTDAHRDAKLRRVQMKYGMEGYGLYWYLLENIASDVNEKKLTFELEHDSEIISHDTGIHHSRVEEIIMFMVRQGLFEESQGVITCLKLLKRLDQSMTSNKKFREDMNRAKEKHGLIMIESGQNHDPVMTKSCKKRSRREVEENKTRRFAPPSIKDVSEYCNSRGNSVDPANFIDHYEANGWMRGKNKIKDWKACVRTWEKNTTPAQSGSSYL